MQILIYSIVLTKTAAQIEVALSYQRVREIYFLEVVFCDDYNIIFIIILSISHAAYKHKIKFIKNAKKK